MNRNILESGFTGIGVMIGVLILVGVGVMALSMSSPSSDEAEQGITIVASEESETLPMNTEEGPAMEESVDESEMSAEADMEATVSLPDDIVVSDATIVTTQEPGTFTEYNENLLANANSGDVLLFFHASWCPSCRALENDINANLDNIPSNVTILKLDYDSETELKQKYGVVRQHTLVRVDSDGNQIETLTGLTNTLDQVVSQL